MRNGAKYDRDAYARSGNAERVRRVRLVTPAPIGPNDRIRTADQYCAVRRGSLLFGALLILGGVEPIDAGMMMITERLAAEGREYATARDYDDAAAIARMV